MPCKSRVIAFSLLVVVACGHSAALSADPQALDLSGVIAKARAREAQVKTLKCKWAVEQLIPKGSLDLPDPTTGLPTTGVPEHDMVFQGVVALVMDGQKVFYRQEGSMYSGRLQGPAPYDWTGTYVDGTIRNLTAEGQGSIGTVGQANSLDYTPFMAAYRLFDPALGKVKADECRLFGRAEHEGHPCVVIESRAKEIADRWWLAEDQDYCPVAWEQQHGQLPGCRAHMEYERDAQGLWRLSSWRLQVIFYGKLWSSQTARVTETKLNEPVDPSIFEIKFPPGTKVYDEFENRGYVVEAEPEPAAEPTSAEAMDRFVEKVRMETAAPAATPEPPAEPKPAAAPRPIPPPAAAPPRELSPWAFVGGGALVVLILAAVYLSRRRAAA